MAGPLYGTEYVAQEITFIRGTVGDVNTVGIYLDTDPNASPEVADFSGGMSGSNGGAIVDLVMSPNPLAEGTKVDILALVGPKTGADLNPAPGDYQVWGLVTTDTEEIIRKTGTLEVA